MTVYLTPAQVITLQGEALSAFGGLPGLRDRPALESSLAQSAMQAFGVELYPTTCDKAAAYLFFLARNHVFVDGNKRTAYASAAVFLLINGFQLSGSDDAVFSRVLGTAQGELADVRAVSLQLAALISPLP